MIDNEEIVNLKECSDKERKQIKKILLKNYISLLNEIEENADYCTVDGYWEDFTPTTKPKIDGKEFIKKHSEYNKEQFIFVAIIGDEIIKPKGFYYQGKYIILVGDVQMGHTIRRKELIDDVIIEIL